MAMTAIDRLEGGARTLDVERRLRSTIFRPPPRLTVSEWADRHRVLTSVASAEPGKWRTDRAPYQRGIMDAFCDPSIDEIVVESSAQVGKTEIILNTIAFFVDQDPSPILIMQPTVELAKAFSKDRLKEMLTASPQLTGKVKESNRRGSDDTLLHKAFPGGHITLVGANSAAGLASRPIRIVLCDEEDRYPASAGDEGDPVSLARKRTATFWNRKIGRFSTPTVKDVSRIDRGYLASDQRRYFVPCPHCRHFQHLRWAQIVFDDAAYACESCGALIPETAKFAMLSAGEWRAQNPGARVVGFHLNALYSPWTSWREIINEFLEAKKAPETLRVFVNTVFGEVWEIGGEGVDVSALAERREQYGAEVPLAVGMLTAAVDVQKDRLEVEVRGWGAGQESWLIEHARLYGDPSRVEVWDRLEIGYLTRAWKHASGSVLAVRSCCIDSGDQTQAVYAFVRPRQRRGVWATKGLSVRGKPLINRPGKPNKYGVRVIPIGTDTAKDVLFARLSMLTPGAPGYMHFPMPQKDGADEEFLLQYAAEKAFIRRVKGIPVREYRAVRDRNEAIDLGVLNLAALHILGAGVYDQLGLWVERAQKPPDPAQKEAKPGDPVANPPRTVPNPRQFRPKGYVGGWQ
jgi:phage terminase large subunit GpA-like protein